MKSQQLFVQLKNTDLACLTAMETLKNLNNITHLSQLNRYKVWTIELNEGATLDPILEKSYYLANPNKESTTLDTLSSNDQNIQLFVTPKGYKGEDKLMKTINQRFNHPILSLSKATMWDIQLSAPNDQELDLIISFLTNPIVDEIKIKTPV